jgi:hypothetical protein
VSLDGAAAADASNTGRHCRKRKQEEEQEEEEEEEEPVIADTVASLSVLPPVIPVALLSDEQQQITCFIDHYALDVNGQSCGGGGRSKDHGSSGTARLSQDQYQL